MPTWNLVTIKYSDKGSSSIIIRVELLDEFISFCRAKNLILLTNSIRSPTSNSVKNENIQNIVIIRCSNTKQPPPNFYELYKEFLHTFYLRRDPEQNPYHGDIYDIIAASPERHKQRFGHQQTTFEQTSESDIEISILEDTAIAMSKEPKPTPIKQLLLHRLMQAILRNYKNSAMVSLLEANQKRDADILTFLDYLEDNKDILRKAMTGNYTILDVYIDASEQQKIPVNKYIIKRFIELGAYTCIDVDKSTGNLIKKHSPVPANEHNTCFLSINFNTLIYCLTSKENILSIREGVACMFLSCMPEQERQELLSIATLHEHTVLDNYLRACEEQFHPVNKEFFNKLISYGAGSIRDLDISERVTQPQLIENARAININNINLHILVSLIAHEMKEHEKVRKIRRLINSLAPYKKYLNATVDGKYTLLDLYLKYTHERGLYISKLVLETFIDNNVGLYIRDSIPTSIEIIRNIISEFSSSPATYSDVILLLGQLGIIVRDKSNIFIIAGKPCNLHKDCYLSETPYSPSNILITYEQLTSDDDFLDQLLTEIMSYKKKKPKILDLIERISESSMRNFVIGQHTLLDLYIKISIKNNNSIHTGIILAFISKGVGLVFYNDQPSSLKELNSITSSIDEYHNLRVAFKKLGIILGEGNKISYSLNNPLNIYLYLPRTQHFLDLVHLADKEFEAANEKRKPERRSAIELISFLDTNLPTAKTKDNAKIYETPEQQQHILAADHANAPPERFRTDTPMPPKQRLC